MRKVARITATAVITGEFPRSMSDILIGRKGYGLVAVPGSHTVNRRIIRNFCDKNSALISGSEETPGRVSGPRYPSKY